MKKETIIKEIYSVTAKNECTITSLKNGKEYVLLTLKAGEQGTFVAISDNVTCTDEQAVILPFA